MNRSFAEVEPLYTELLSMGARDLSIPRTLLARAIAGWGNLLAKEGRTGETEPTLLSNAGEVMPTLWTPYAMPPQAIKERALYKRKGGTISRRASPR